MIMQNTPSRPSPRSGTQSIERVVALLRELTTCRKGASSAQLAARTGIDRSTAHRMLQCLAAEDLLAYDAAYRRYSFGRLAYHLGLPAPAPLDLPQLCKPAPGPPAD